MAIQNARKASIEAFLAKHRGKTRLEDEYQSARSWIRGILHLIKNVDEQHFIDIKVLQNAINHLSESNLTHDEQLYILLGLLDYCDFQSEKYNNIALGALIKGLLQELPTAKSLSDTYETCLKYLKNEAQQATTKKEKKIYKRIGKHLIFRKKLLTASNLIEQYTASQKTNRSTESKSWLEHSDDMYQAIEEQQKNRIERNHPTKEPPNSNQQFAPEISEANQALIDDGFLDEDFFDDWDAAAENIPIAFTEEMLETARKESELNEKYGIQTNRPPPPQELPPTE